MLIQQQDFYSSLCESKNLSLPSIFSILEMPGMQYPVSFGFAGGLVGALGNV